MLKKFFDLFSENPTYFQEGETRKYGLSRYAEKVGDPEPHHLDGICWGGRVWGKALPPQSANKNFCFVGTVGSGKTVSIKLLLQTVLPFITHGEFDHRALVYDPKHEMIPFLLGLNQYLRKLEEKDAVKERRTADKIDPIEVKSINPFDKQGYAWDIARDITERAHAQEIAAILIPLEPNAQQPFFGDAARHLLDGVITALMLSAGQKWAFRDVMYAMGTKERIAEVLNLHEETRELISLYFDHQETAKNIMSTVATKLSPFKIVAALWDRAEKKVGKVSLTDWLKSRDEKGRQNYILVLSNDETARTAIDAINRVIFKRTTQLILNQPDVHPDYDVMKMKDSGHEIDKRRHWIVLDELRNAGKLDGLQSLMTKGRSKGAAVVLSFQDVDGLRTVYGKDETNEIVGQCSTYAVFRLQSPDTSEWASRVFGSGEVMEEYEDQQQGGVQATGTSEQHPVGMFSKSDSSVGSSTTNSYSWGTSKRIAYREAKVIHPSQFTYLPPAGFKEGLSGWYLSPYAKKPYGLNISGDVLFGSGGWLAKPVDYEIKRRDAQWQKLEPWSNEERQRLGLNESILAVAEMKEALEPFRQLVRQVKNTYLEVELIAREYAELAFYRGETLTEEELEGLRAVSPQAEAMYLRILQKLKKDAGDISDLIEILPD